MGSFLSLMPLELLNGSWTASSCQQFKSKYESET